MALDVLDHDNGVVHHDADRQHDGEQGQQVDGKPEDVHQGQRPDQGQGHRHDRDEHRPDRAHEQEDDDHHDQQRLEERAHDLVERVVDVLRGVIGDLDVQAGGQGPLDLRHDRPDALDDLDRAVGRQHPEAHEGGRLAAELDLGVVILGAEDDVGHVGQVDDGAVALGHHQLAELLDVLEIGVRDQADADHRALGGADGGEGVVGLQGLPDLGRTEAAGGQLLGLEPDAHCEDAAAEHVGALDALHRRQPGLHHAVEVVRDLVLVERLGIEAQVGRRELAVRGLDADGRRLGLGRELVADLVDLRADLGQGGVGVVVEPQVDLDGADPGAARGLDVVDAVRAGDDALQLGGDVAPHRVGAGPEIDGGDADDGAVTPRILAGVELRVRHDAHDQDDDVHHQRDDGLADEQVGKAFG